MFVLENKTEEEHDIFVLNENVSDQDQELFLQY